MEKEEYIGSANLSEQPSRGKRFVLRDDTVNTRHLKDGIITKEKIAPDFFEEFANIVSDRAIEILLDKVIKDKFGNNTDATISQKLLTDTINDIYAKFREIEGEPPVGIYMTVTPEYFIGEEGAHVHIEAITSANIFEKIAFYKNDELIPGAEAESVFRLEADVDIDDTSTIKCTATILGMDYTVEKTVIHYNSFWIGAGSSYRDIMDTSHVIPIDGGILRGAYDITCNEGDHFIIIVGEALRQGFIRADLNGFEIPFNLTKITKDGNIYWVMMSENQYHQGTYNIDING